jgi:hypothetical protein
MYDYNIHIKSNFNGVDITNWINNNITFGANGHVHMVQCNCSHLQLHCTIIVQLIATQSKHLIFNYYATLL